jgi:plasmid stabilization system protein ParE
VVSLEWTPQAFGQLETLPDAIAFEVIRRTDVLATFPEMGVSLRSQYQTFLNYRQLIIKSRYRVIYRFDESSQTIFIAAVQHCRQKLPTYSDLQRSIGKKESE